MIRRLQALCAWLFGPLYLAPPPPGHFRLAPFPTAAATLFDNGTLTALVDTTYSLPTGGATWNPTTGSQLQSNINSAALGDVIVIASGSVLGGTTINLPAKSGSGWIYVMASAAAANLPQDRRVNVADASFMAAYEAPAGQAAFTSTNGHHYRFVGIEIRPANNAVILTGLVTLSVGATSPSNVSHHIIFDRCYVHGRPGQQGPRRAFQLDGANNAVINSYIDDIKDSSDSQAIWMYNSPGPFCIKNNYLSAAGETWMTGGSDNASAAMNPADTEFRYNTVTKNSAWAGVWVVKNLLELKNAQRVLVEGNAFDNEWADGQQGYAVLFTVRNQKGGASWSIVEDVDFRFNRMRKVSQGFSITGSDYRHPTQDTNGLRIYHNDIDVEYPAGTYATPRRMFIMSRGPDDVLINHNTIRIIQAGDGAITYFLSSPSGNNLIMVNNIFDYGAIGVFGEPSLTGTAALNAWWTGYSCTKNVMIAGGSSGSYPAGNFFAANTAAVGFVNVGTKDYHLSGSSPYKGLGVDPTTLVADGSDLGANIDLVNTAIANMNFH